VRILTKKMELQVGETVAVATMLENEAPKTCKAIWDNLPIENEAHHAKIAGPELYFMAIPKIIIEEMENPVKVHQVPSGTISYYPVRPYIQVFFGDLVPVWNIDVNRFAQITENLEGLKMAARRAWTRPGERIIFRRGE